MTDEELNLKFIAFCEIIDIFEELKIDYFVGGNVLLGIMRTGDFIPRKLGTAIALKYEQYESVKKIIIEKLLDKNFEVRENKNGLKNKIKAIKNENFFEITPWYIDGKNRIRKKYILPNKYFKIGHFEKLRGRLFQTFNPPVKYLKFRFGETWVKDIDSTNRKKFENQRYWRK